MLTNFQQELCNKIVEKYELHGEDSVRDDLDLIKGFYQIEISKSLEGVQYSGMVHPRRVFIAPIQIFEINRNGSRSAFIHGHMLFVQYEDLKIFNLSTWKFEITKETLQIDVHIKIDGCWHHKNIDQKFSAGDILAITPGNFILTPGISLS